MKSINITVLFITIIMSFTSVLAAGTHSGGHEGHSASHWASPPGEANRENPVMADHHSIETGAGLFQQYCSSCHGTNADGKGPAGMALNPPPTNLVAMSGHHPDGDFAWKIKNGRGAMPAWDQTFDDTEVWHLVNFIQSLEGEKLSMGDHGEHQHGH